MHRAVVRFIMATSLKIKEIFSCAERFIAIPYAEVPRTKRQTHTILPILGG